MSNDNDAGIKINENQNFNMIVKLKLAHDFINVKLLCVVYM